MRFLHLKDCGHVAAAVAIKQLRYRIVSNNILIRKAIKIIIFR